jgi:ABC-type antimicrobial peptide transport system permease subunit
MVLAQTLRLTAVGAAIGIGGALLAARSLRGFVYGVDVYDVRSFGAVVVFLLMIGLVAGAVPAFRASRVDPARALAAD